MLIALLPSTTPKVQTPPYSTRMTFWYSQIEKRWYRTVSNNLTFSSQEKPLYSLEFTQPLEVSQSLLTGCVHTLPHTVGILWQGFSVCCLEWHHTPHHTDSVTITIVHVNSSKSWVRRSIHFSSFTRAHVHIPHVVLPRWEQGPQETGFTTSVIMWTKGEPMVWSCEPMVWSYRKDLVAK